ncbi:hypothetical protein EYF80_021691 [Liparis tanakae]|uniref:Uncharacterized protein n=1 Tax=Liparis tanakae TaxID=230148 RepID=A0A4Z2HQC5_9TELE|nr:hypothetical protein EYF80_021691 [Liparis tanakae]
MDGSGVFLGGSSEKDSVANDDAPLLGLHRPGLELLLLEPPAYLLQLDEGAGRRVGGHVNEAKAPAYQSYSLQPLLQLLPSRPLPQDALQSADQLRGESLRLHVDVLGNPVGALRGGKCQNCKAPPCGRRRHPGALNAPPESMRSRKLKKS